MSKDAAAYRATLGAAERFAEALLHAEDAKADRDPRLQRALEEGIEGDLETLRAEIAAYEARLAESRRA